MRRAWLYGLMMLAFVGVCGCRSRYVEATVRNASGAAVTVVEIDYPSASFGAESLAAGAEYHYRFKIQGEGATKVLWADKAGKDHTVTGPTIHEGDEGTLQVILGKDGAEWHLQVTPK